MEKHARELVAAIVGHGLKQRLKAAGFKKNALTFRAEAEHCTRVVSVRVSWPRSLPDGRLILDLGVIHPAIEEAFTFSIRTLPAWTLRTTLGQRPAARIGEVPWKIDAGSDAARIGAEIVEQYAARGEHWFERCASVERIHQALTEDPSFAHMDDALLPVVIATLCRDRAAMQARLAQVIETTLEERRQRALPNDPYGTALLAKGKALAEEHGLEWKWEW